MRILLVSRLFPIPHNVARGTFVSDHAELLASLGHEVKIVNVLPRMLRMNEARRSTMEGVAKAPKKYDHGDFTVEGWFNLDTTSSANSIVGVWDYENAQRSWHAAHIS